MMNVITVVGIILSVVCTISDAEGVDCTLPSDTGRCKAYFIRYFYNQKAGECQKFVYGGCEGNSNNFLTKSDCCKQCSPGKC
uniref:Kunitz-type serine protease inhibitor BmKTT-2 n=1 Tax=Olivierus martensii TaxID=34649 RepID=VKT31_OLIMR|nr:RecName: Full=Kunitz-type serine protease inhibitor BmKTT-2; AltName: Full=Delta-KTx 3.1; Flags: Precursor [Mesobuthus martensii]